MKHCIICIVVYKCTSVQFKKKKPFYFIYFPKEIGCLLFISIIFLQVESQVFKSLRRKLNFSGIFYPPTPPLLPLILSLSLQWVLTHFHLPSAHFQEPFFLFFLVIVHILLFCIVFCFYFVSLILSLCVSICIFSQRSLIISIFLMFFFRFSLLHISLPLHSFPLLPL